ncbi:hypothetical protein [Natrinema sp. SYSU A 869]|uniref:hypothetical protein n=1 Tax=Natrinema sp. SYSU A 869 TaxID=2871694 RepID=UPI001CA3EB03|nr:hypothetical protein [Natrinema sp. SYSU A 869]
MDGNILEEMFHPHNLQTVWEAVDLSGGTGQPEMAACGCLVEALAEYDWHIRHNAADMF